MGPRPTAECRRFRARRGARCLAVIALVAGTAMVAGCGLGDSASPALDPVVTTDGRVAGGVQIGDQVFVVTHSDRAESTEILTVSPETGRVVSSVEVPLGQPLHGVAASDGRLVVRVSEPVADLPVIGEVAMHPAIRQPPTWLVVIDPEASDRGGMAPLEQYALPAFDLYEPLIVVDGVYHLLGNGLGDGTIDLRSGVASIGSLPFGRRFVDIRRLDDRLLLIRRTEVVEYDLTTATAIDRWFSRKVFELVSEQLPGGGFRYHQGQVWMSGFGPDDLDQVYRYDLDTEEMTDPRPAAAFPLLSFELAPIGLDLFRDGGGEPAGYNRAPDPEPGDTWRLTDLASGEVIGDFDFGHWSPLFATDDHLWLTKGEAGQELARFEFGG